VVPKPNLWRRSQRIFYVAAATPDALAETFGARGQQLRSAFTDVTLQRMEREMYEEERRTALEDSLMQRHGVSLNVQHDFQLAVDTTTAREGFVWLRRILARTRREFLVYYTDKIGPDEITPQWIHATRDSLTRRHLRGNVQGFVHIDYRRALDTEQQDFLDRYGFETRGLWYMVIPKEDAGGVQPVGGGGPFVNFTFLRPGHRPGLHARWVCLCAGSRQDGLCAPDGGDGAHLSYGHGHHGQPCPLRRC